MKPTYLVVSHDAGGAEIISSYLRNHQGNLDFFAYTAGPAERIFLKKKLPGMRTSASSDSLEAFFMQHPAIPLLCGTSWASRLELDALALARTQGRKTIVYLDHWVHFRERFGYPHTDWTKNLPDIFWVGDEYAYAIAKRDFPGCEVVFVPNEYFSDVQEEYRMFAKSTSRGAPHSLLFMSEPLSEAINIFGDTDHVHCTEWDILRLLLEDLAQRQVHMPVVIRLHPSEPRDKYDLLMRQFKDIVPITLSDAPTIYEDLVHARMVIGMESMGLVIAYLCGKKVVSFLPEGAPCPLPFAEIQKVSNADDLKNHII